MGYNCWGSTGRFLRSGLNAHFTFFFDYEFTPYKLLDGAVAAVITLGGDFGCSAHGLLLEPHLTDAGTMSKYPVFERIGCFSIDKIDTLAFDWKLSMSLVTVAIV